MTYLDKVNIGSIVEQSSHVVTQSVVLPQTLGQAVHSLLRTSDGDQVVDPGLWTPLSQASHEKAALGEPNCMGTI